MEQIDLGPTLALLLGLPVPQNRCLFARLCEMRSRALCCCIIKVVQVSVFCYKNKFNLQSDNVVSQFGFLRALWKSITLSMNSYHV